jgi:hypothetical protein
MPEQRLWVATMDSVFIPMHTAVGGEILAGVPKVKLSLDSGILDILPTPPTLFAVTQKASPVRAN